MSQMKMKHDDFVKIEKAVKGAMEWTPTLDDYIEAGYSPMRYRWDMLYYSRYPITDLYSYLNDDHIDTALRRITKTN